MKQIKVSELSGAALDWAVAKCEGVEYRSKPYTQEIPFYFHEGATSDWSQGGPIIERERITVSALYAQRDSSFPEYKLGEWCAFIPHGPQGTYHKSAHDPLIAAMRCYVASKLGDVVEIPEELL